MHHLTEPVGGELANRAKFQKFWRLSILNRGPKARTQPAIGVSPRTVGKYIRRQRSRNPDPGQRWITFIRNHADSMVACDFCTVVTANFRILYVSVVMEIGRRSIPVCQRHAHLTVEWTLQQLAKRYRTPVPIPDPR